MKNRNTRIIMGILVGLVLFTSSVALLLYLRQSKANAHATQNIEVYVAAKDLKKGDYIGADAITKASVPKSYITFTPLLPEEIIGRYAKVNIFAKEPIRQEKLSITNPSKQKPQQKTEVFKDINKSEQITTKTQDTFSIPLKVFKNKDNSLKVGDFVDIVSVVPKKASTRDYAFTTRYIALHLRINSFISKHVLMKKFTRTITVLENKKSVRKTIEADTIVLEMAPKDIKNFLALYYTTQALNNNRAYNTANYGGQLWLVNAATPPDQQIEKEKQKMLFDKKRVMHKRHKRVQKVSIDYEK